MFPTDNLAQQQEIMRAAHVKHAGGPSVANRFSLAYALWRIFYEARAALRDQNPGFAKKLLPKKGLVLTALGFPMIPAGVRAAVDDTAPGTITVTVDVSATLTVRVTPPGSTTAQTLPALPGATRQTLTFPALVDGLYELTLLVGGSKLATIYVGVLRARMRDFRELSRHLAFDFKPGHNPKSTDDYDELLAVLYAADAAAATSQTSLFYQLADEADAITKSPKPTALFPHRGK